MTIVYILAALLVGWLIGFLDSNLRTSKKIEAAENKARLAVSEAEKKLTAAQAQGKSGMPTSVDEPGLLRLKNVNGTASLEVDGTQLDVGSVSADQKRRLIELLAYIRPWVEGGQPLKPVSKPVPPFSAPIHPITQPVPLAKPVEEKNIKALSIVAQIDTVLQARLADSFLAGRGVRLTESSIGGVEVYVGLQKYASLDDVPDLEIKTAIRGAIEEWERKFTPGL